VSSGFAKAVIVRLDKQNKACEMINVMFNPKELVFNKQNTWNHSKSPKSNVPACDFASGGQATLKLTLFFDTYKDGKDVRKEYTDKIYQLMYIDPALTNSSNKKSRPPIIRFQWGSTISFDGVITSIGQKFTLFLPDSGTPVRAVLDVTMAQVKDELFYPPQNPTSGGVGGERVWTVKAGDTLAWIAFNEYSDPTEWRRIAEANRLYDVRTLKPGMMLLIPNL
jgi:Contractile injection system tube protein/LysM domain